MPERPADGGPRLIDAMPRPLLVLFIALGVIAIGASLLFLIKPPRTETVAVHARRPPSTERVTHDVGRIFPAPLPSLIKTFDPPCREVQGVTGLGGPSAVERVHLMMRQICRLARGGVGPEIATAIEGFRPGASIRTAQFELTGVDSTVDLRERVIYLNTKFVLAKTPIRSVLPVVLHEAWHLARSGRTITAGEELAARTVELAACRELVRVTDWPRWCSDANTLVSLPQERAIALLVSAGYPSDG